MWTKRQKGRGDRSVSGPSLDCSVLETPSQVSLAPKNISKDLPALPSEIPETSHEADPAPLASPIRAYQDYSQYADDDPGISPPDSPIDVSGTRPYSSHNVSPIENDAGHFFPEPSVKRPSQIPVPRRYSQSNMLNYESGHESPADTNPTIRKAGTEQVLSSSSALPKAAKPKSKQHQHAASLLQSGREKLQILSKTWDQKQQSGQRPREQWKGASGRAPLMGPIETNTSARKFPSRSNSPHVGHNFVDYGPDTYTVTTITAGNSSDEKPRKKSRQPKKKSEPRDTPSKSSLALPISGAGSDEVKEKEEEEAHQTPVADKLTPLENTTDFSSMFQKLDLIDEPRSRFSASTYDPTELATTPPGSAGSDSPPVPDIPPSPIMTRRRPVPGYATSIKSTKRKPVGSETPPPEVDLKDMTPHDRAQYRINSLQIRSNELSKRKTSVKTMLHELTQVIQPSSIAYDMATRDEVKKSVTSLNNELAEITKEEHDLGVKLSRAYRKLDSADFYEHSSLWVKSIDR
ncbi:hypothetical protein PISL3812_03396 [Talaromyces islandicus]|uniref:Uncharacterized protein n=1 Tax=Talaromyces islandicus TaxID=28573 RepID=A0A0U1LUZ1_TALIS|nr:hypothetical protein PISL3812_03396 [Talaromyces islandicus]